MSDEAKLPEVQVTTKARPQETTRTRRVPPYQVILENDDYHSFAFVIEVLCKVLGCAPERAYQLALQAHTSGRAAIWTGPKEVAELKADQLTTFHEIRESDQAHLGPLGCTIEPAPGS